jgi:peptide/nickel transport system ATP-binding protein
MIQENPLLAVNDLGVSFRSGETIQSAIQHVSFDVFPGKTLAIVGESGSGKTVSSLSIMSLLPRGKAIFDSGSFTFDSSAFSLDAEKSAHILPSDELLKAMRGHGVAMIFQEPMTSLNPVMTCGEQVSEMLRKHLALGREEAWSRTLELFREVLLPRPEAILTQYPHQLSGGQRQRVMIAMAISCNPKILIADEPTTALDVTVQKEILTLLKNLQEKHGMAMIFITHDLGVVAEIADTIVVMCRGKIVERGLASNVLKHPEHTYTKGLLACRPQPGEKREQLITLADFEKPVKSAPNSIKVPDLKKAAPDTTKVLLDVHGVSKVYSGVKKFFQKSPEVVAVKNVSFAIHTGETLGLVGESGCGKTTLSRMLLGLIPATGGSIVYDTKKYGVQDITTLAKSELRKLRKEIQIIFQDPYSSLNPKHTIGDAITEPMRVFDLHETNTKRKKHALELLEKVGMKPELYDRYPHEFSGGQRQRIVIARALACEPSFIICDESVSALDVSVQAQVLNLLNDLKRDFGLTYLFISHDLNVVYHMSDRILVMNKGSVEEIGTCDQVFFHPQSDYTKRLLAAIPGR